MEEGEKITEKKHVFITETKIAQILVSGIWEPGGDVSEERWEKKTGGIV